MGPLAVIFYGVLLLFGMMAAANDDSGGCGCLVFLLLLAGLLGLFGS